MVRTTNTRSRAYVQSTLAFKAHNLSAEWRGPLYVVLSYGYWPLFIYDQRSGKWYENSDRYSVTTSKQRSQSHPWEDTHKATRAACDAFIEDNALLPEVAELVRVSA